MKISLSNFMDESLTRQKFLTLLGYLSYSRNFIKNHKQKLAILYERLTNYESHPVGRHEVLAVFN